MHLKLLVLLWLLITAAMSYDYMYFNNMRTGASWIEEYLCRYFRYCNKLSPIPGRPLSFWLGWIGFGTLALGNFYIMRKHVVKLRKFGNLQTWLDWHIFFGLMGPTFIVFHCNFEVNGLVSISFWSMMVSAVSGVVGRYFYIQLLQSKSSLKDEIRRYETGFGEFVKAIGANEQSVQAMKMAQSKAFAMAGGVTKGAGLSTFLFMSIVGDIRMMISLPPVPWKRAKPLRKILKKWAIKRKKLLSMHIYQILFGYWRAFHTPFAVFMYAVAIIHIISSLIFKVH